jgi:hypothetical protein
METGSDSVFQGGTSKAILSTVLPMRLISHVTLRTKERQTALTNHGTQHQIAKARMLYKGRSSAIRKSKVDDRPLWDAIFGV